MSLQWHCPYCEAAATIGDNDYSTELHHFEAMVRTATGRSRITYILTSQFVHCPSPNCRQALQIGSA